MNSHEEKQYFLRQALVLAEIRKGFCSPNPSVGCIIVQDGKVIGQGYHWGSGYPHAEVEALSNINVSLRGATLYVTLEPCCHWGKTPPCTSLILERGIKHVVYGYLDPNPNVKGQGAALLSEEGVFCEYIPLPEIQEFYLAYQFWHENRQPYTIAKLAMSLDNKIAGVNYQPIKITSDAAQQFTHHQRKQADAILTTARTINIDSPQLSVRILNNPIQYKPLYILDSHLSINPEAKIFDSVAPITLFHLESASQERINVLIAKGARCLAISSSLEGLNLQEVLSVIGQEGMHSLWIEAGSRCFSAFLKQHLLQKAFIYIAPTIIGTQGIPAFDTQENILADAVEMKWQIASPDIIAEFFFNKNTLLG